MKDHIHLSVRMNLDIHRKITYIAGYEGRSMSAQILYLLQKYIREFEGEHGKIPMEVPED